MILAGAKKAEIGRGIGQQSVLRGSLLVWDEAHPYYRDARKQMLGEPHERSRIEAVGEVRELGCGQHLELACARAAGLRLGLVSLLHARAWLWPRAMTLHARFLRRR
ncbi:hypothetical protein T492DRAFT_863743 [Pavlovales sp. CCMP2436]|nr:hypothetical protein T492DRAFT_863743 [Pavlovales sp. CCMP2436]